MRVKSALAKNCDAMAHHTLLVIVVGLSTVSPDIAGSCLNCFNTCNEDGLCDDYGCQAGYHGDNCSLPCPANCRNGVFKKPACARNTSICLSGCRGGFFSERCDQQCPSTCANKVCHQVDGYCRDGCKEHWHGPDCTAKCNTTCFKSTCDRNGLCQPCETGYWGLFCENNCGQHCLNNICAMSQDGSFECSSGCQKGWKGAGCEEPSLEEMGHSDTRRKRDSSDCYVNEVDGKCPCCRRNTGERCEINCPKCEARYNGSECNRVCEQGYYNGIKELCGMPCGKNCAPGTDNKTYCNPTDGGCSSCRSGYHGHMCGFTCSGYCLNKTCSIHSGYCLHCSNVTFGDHCEPCSEFCIDKFCHRWNGTCMTGCTLGKYGVMCSHDCPTNCYKSHCSLSIYGNVFCTGCKDGFTGSSCEERCLVNCTTCRQVDGECIVYDPGAKPGVEPWKIAVPTTLVVVAVVVVAGLIATFVCKRRQRYCWKTDSHLRDKTEIGESTPLQDDSQLKGKTEIDETTPTGDGKAKEEGEDQRSEGDTAISEPAAKSTVKTDLDLHLKENTETGETTPTGDGEVKVDVEDQRLEGKNEISLGAKGTGAREDTSAHIDGANSKVSYTQVA